MIKCVCKNFSVFSLKRIDKGSDSIENLFQRNQNIMRLYIYIYILSMWKWGSFWNYSIYRGIYIICKKIQIAIRADINISNTSEALSKNNRIKLVPTICHFIGK